MTAMHRLFGREFGPTLPTMHACTSRLPTVVMLAQQTKVAGRQC